MTQPSLEDYLKSLERFGMKPGLERINALLCRVGNPQRSFVALHVAGTNGKGSVCAMVESVLIAAGFKTGLYTSPHLVSWRERIRVNGIEADPSEIEEIGVELERHAGEIALSVGAPTYFEFLTALAFVYFARRGVKYAVLETGLGGRLDATNTVDSPVAAITGIGLEHQAQLGNSIEAIAGEKAGIIKRKAAVVCGPMGMEALAVIERKCLEESATMRAVGGDILFDLVRQSSDGIVLNIHGAKGAYTALSIPLAGGYQAGNCAVAVGMIEALQDCNAVVSSRAIYDGMAAVRWPGRMEVASRSPLLLMDCAHNPQAARALSQALKGTFPDRRWIVVLGILRDKDIRGICEALLPAAAAFVVTGVPSVRSASGGEISSLLKKMGPAPVYEAQSLSAALLSAGKLQRNDGHAGILITGSTYLVGEAKRIGACDLIA